MQTETNREAKAQARTVLEFIDCDVHNGLPSAAALLPHLPEQWHGPYRQLTNRVQMPTASFYQTRSLSGGPYRVDARPPSGNPPGSDFEFARQQLLESWPIRNAILSPLDGLSWPQEGPLAAALTAALNDWVATQWLDRDSRFLGTIVVPVEDSERAAREIAHRAADDRFVQVLMYARTREPLGHAKYWPIYDAAAERDLPVVVHVGGSGNPITGAGWGSYHFEEHASFTWAMQAHVVSLVTSGLFDRLPKLKIVLEEGGFTWVPALMWRMDRAWRQMGPEFAGLTEAPSAIIRRHFYFTTQPMDEVDSADHLMATLRHLDMDDHVMYSTDYPHWDFDAPDRALPAAITGELRTKIMRTNAEHVFRFPKPKP